jgi:Calx-beta domain/Subtilase family
MKKLTCRTAYSLPALVGAVLFGLVTFGVSASAGTSSPSGDGRQPLFAPSAEASASLSNLALKKGGKLSSRLQQLSQPSLLTASAKTQAAAIGLPRSGPGSLLRATGGKQLLVYVRVSGSVASASAAIENAGAAIVNASKRYGVVSAAVSPNRLQALGKLSVVANAQEALAPMLSAACPTGDVVSEGDTQLAAASARSTFGVDGSGVTVGILSDSYDAFGDAPTGVSAGELPGTGNPCGRTTPVNVLEDDTYSGIDEGRAMLEVVHDLAPGAALAFATADTGIYGMADNIRALRNAGAKVIADDVTYLAEPMFQEGPIDVAVDDVTSSGVSYFSSAGNNNLVVGGHNVGSYESPAYRPTSCPAELDAITSPDTYADCHNFDPGAGIDSGADYTLAANGYLNIDLQWAEPWAGVGTDLDIILIDADTGALLDYSTYSNSGVSGTQEPFEYMGDYQNTTGAPENVEVIIARWSGAALPRLKYVLLSSHGVTSAEYNISSDGDVVGPTIFGHNGGQNTISTAAVRYSDSTTPEPYSSHGPVTYYYGPVNGTTPAAPLSSPLVLSKPDIAATDCAATSFFYQWDGSAYRFCGTSEAAPHAAAVAALMLNHGLTLTPAQVLARLKTTAHAVPNDGTSDVVGSGLIDALGAVGVLSPTFAFSSASYSVNEADGSATVTINRTGLTTGSDSVNFATANGTATAGSDYTAVDQTVSFAAGETTKTVVVPITDDSLIEGNETVQLSLSTPSTGATLGSPSSATLTIVDNDRAFAFSSAGYSVGEGDGTATVTINRTGLTTGSDSVHFAMVNGTAKAGSDFRNVSQTVSFAPGETSKTISVPITNDKVHEANETVSLTLSGPSLGAVLGSPSTATLTIVDNDKPGKIASARLTKKSFKRVQARKVKLVLRFSPQSAKFNYLLTRKKGARWPTVRNVKKTGSFAGKRTYTVKALFRGKSIKAGRYRLKLTAEGNSKTLAFRVT